VQARARYWDALTPVLRPSPLQAGLLSLLTAVLLHAAPSCTPAEAQPHMLPSNFTEVRRLHCAFAR